MFPQCARARRWSCGRDVRASGGRMARRRCAFTVRSSLMSFSLSPEPTPPRCAAGSAAQACWVMLTVALRGRERREGFMKSFSLVTSSRGILNIQSLNELTSENTSSNRAGAAGRTFPHERTGVVGVAIYPIRYESESETARASPPQAIHIRYKRPHLSGTQHAHTHRVERRRTGFNHKTAGRLTSHRTGPHSRWRRTPAQPPPLGRGSGAASSNTRRYLRARAPWRGAP